MHSFDFTHHLGQADKIDAWQDNRMRATLFCQDALDSLQASSTRRASRLSLKSLFDEKSDERMAFERRLICAIMIKERKLRRNLALDASVNATTPDPLPPLNGSNLRDLCKSVVESGDATASRFAPGILGASRLGAVLASVTSLGRTIGSAAVNVSEYAWIAVKRRDYLKEIHETLTSVMVGEENSVLSRQLAQINKYYKIDI